MSDKVKRSLYSVKNSLTATFENRVSWNLSHLGGKKKFYCGLKPVLENNKSLKSFLFESNQKHFQAVQLSLISQ